MEKRITYCDRCGKEFSPLKIIDGYKVYHGAYHVAKNNICFDLCEKCCDELTKWVEGGNKDDRSKCD